MLDKRDKMSQNLAIDFWNFPNLEKVQVAMSQSGIQENLSSSVGRAPDS